MKLRVLILLFVTTFFLPLGFILYESTNYGGKGCTQPKVIYQAALDLGLDQLATCFHLKKALARLATYESPIDKSTLKLFNIVGHDPHFARKTA